MPGINNNTRCIWFKNVFFYLENAFAAKFNYFYDKNNNSKGFDILFFQSDGLFSFFDV